MQQCKTHVSHGFSTIIAPCDRLPHCVFLNKYYSHVPGD
ncbi:Protein of unknown function [Pyronema omphalodes CBS 100304]|uniref:Uncharacterized protein n=1 Tax=Pyronema omphalodes (strain CBS 100304) TaxID=1076935 RepID=U4KWY0_PYROM|nr:Protein of unknown function [Pyronema omphalodes CBS 100304]